VSFELEVPEGLIEELVERVAARLREEPERRFLSKSALADHLGVSERRIKTLRERGLPARKIGRDLYFDVDEVTRFIEREGVT
jgi:ribosome-binding protein aMBF1 (putative translation factor)